MTRNVSAANLTANAAEIVRPVRLVELDFVSSFIRFASTPFSVFFDADGDLSDEEFLGVGNLGSVSALGEAAGAQSGRFTISISGVEPALISTALGEKYQGRTAKVWRGNFDENHALVGPPDLERRGLMDTMPIKLRRTGTISVVVVDRFARWEKPLDNPRWDNTDHQARRPGDKFFEFVPELVAGRESIWGRG